ncbi:hypothetical protein AXF42_Ash017913 [Apostasia shenzhenica]|uniref:Uncharacterized protein n=1 Tax=Apostasia shenzhenica TaxID=1088818 RepID=A0A2I0AY77_9ASPA|nr:hypothetical protein AXF42_Ash017913 [Apostasia shenzhenica]
MMDVDNGVLPGKDGTGLLPPLKEGSSNIPDTSWSHLLEKAAPPLCITDNNILTGHGSNINTNYLRECGNDTVRNTIYSSYPLPGTRGVADQNKLSYISSADDCLSMLSKGQKNGEHDLLSYDCPNVGDFEDFDRMFSFFQIHKGTLLCKMRSQEGFHDVYTKVLPAIDSSISGNHIPLNTCCNSFPLGFDAERKGKSVLSELAYDDIWADERNSTLEQLCSGNECSDSIMINTTLNDLTTYRGKEINPDLESIAYSSSGGCGLIQDFKDQELLSSILSAPQPCSLQAISKQILSTDCFASNSFNSFSFQEQLSGILAMQQVPIIQSTLDKSGIESSALPYYGTSIDPSVQNSQLMGIFPDPFSIQPTLSFENSEIIYASQLFPATLVVDKHVEQHNAASVSLGQGQNKFQDGRLNKELAFTNLSLPKVSILSSTSQENSFMSPTFSDDEFLKANSFQQFQMIAEQKGTRTKLCIRDSLYRLARSAEQRHHCDIADNVSSDTRLMHQGPNELSRHPEFSGMSNGLNAIDRSVAHLLFHKSLGSGSASADDAQWLIPSMHVCSIYFNPATLYIFCSTLLANCLVPRNEQIDGSAGKFSQI